MITIIRRGKVEFQEFRKVCPHCQTEFLYTEEDLMANAQKQKNMGVECPVCFKFIPHQEGN